MIRFWPWVIRCGLPLVVGVLILAGTMPARGGDTPVLQVAPTTLSRFAPSAFSPDGSLLALAHAQDGIALWETNTGRFVHAIAYPPGCTLVTRRPEEWGPVSISPDNAFLGAPLQSDAGQVLVIWDIRTGAVVLTLDGRADPANPVFFGDFGPPAFLPDGQTFLLDASNSVSVYAFPSAQRQATLGGPGPQEFMSGMTVSPNGRWLAVNVATTPPGMPTGNATVRIYDAQTRALKFTLDNQKFREGSLRFSPDSTQLLSDDLMAGITYVADTDTGTIFAPLTRATRPEGKPLVTPFHSVFGVQTPARVAFFNLAAEAPIWELKEHPYPVQGALISPNGRYLAVNTRTATEAESEMAVWDIKDRKCLWRRGFRTLAVQRLVFAPSGKVLAVEGDGLHVQMISLSTGSITKRFTPPEVAFSRGALSANAKLTAFAGGDATDAIVTDAATQAVKWRTPIGKHTRVPLLFTPDGRYLAIGLTVQTLGGPQEKTRLLDLTSGAIAWEKPGRPLAVTPDSTLVAVSMANAPGVHFLAIDGGAERGVLDAAQGCSNLAFFTADPFVAGVRQENIYLWAPPQPRAYYANNLTMNNAAVVLTAVAAAPKTPLLALGTRAGDVFTVPVTARGVGTFATYPGNGQTVSALAFSPDGTLLASGTEKGVITLRDAVTGTILAVWQLFPTLRQDPTTLDWLVATPDGAFNCAESTKALLAWNVAGKILPLAEHEKTYLNPEKVKEALKRP